MSEFGVRQLSSPSISRIFLQLKDSQVAAAAQVVHAAAAEKPDSA
jgi:hypothetical protein